MRAWMRTKLIIRIIATLRYWNISKVAFVGDKIRLSPLVVNYDRLVTNEELLYINDYLDGKRFMSRYHNGQKKEKEKKERKRKEGITTRTQDC